MISNKPIGNPPGISIFKTKDYSKEGKGADEVENELRMKR